MADEIINTLGFNVDSAIASLRALDIALQGGQAAFGNFATTLDNFNSRARTALDTMRGLATAASRVAGAASSMTLPAESPAAHPAASAASSGLWLPPGVEASAQRMTTALTNAGNAGRQAGQQTAAAMSQAANATNQAAQYGDRLYVSWNTLVRVVMTQTIVRAMSQVRDALRESVDAAIDFQKRIAEIQTAAPRIGESMMAMPTPFAALEQEVVNFAKNFNFPLPQVAEGLYQTISDQFTSVSDRANIMMAAMELAKVGVMNFQDAATLLTGTLNAYGMSSGQASSASAQFFETIRLGHVRGEELAATYGQIIPVAGELGVSLKEVNAAMVALTIGGLDAHKSTTALRQAMVAFLKPSEDMKRVVREMGFSDPNQLIAAKSLVGAIQAIDTATRGASLEMAKSFRNVRAELAVFRLASEEGAKKYAEALKAMEAATPEALSKIVSEFRSTDAEKLTTQINALKTNLTQGFGQAMVGVLKSVMEMAGGADKLAAAITAIAAAAVPCAAAVGMLALAFGAMHLAMGPIGWALLAITTILATTVGAYTYQTTMAIAKINEESDARHQATLKMMRDEDAKIAKWKETAQAEARASQGNWEERMSVIRKNYIQQLDVLKKENASAVDSARQVMESMISAQERVVAAYRNAANAAVRAVQDSQNRTRTLEAQYSDTAFRYLEDRRDIERQIYDYRARGLDLARQASEQLSRARTPDEIQAALATFQRAEAAVKESETLAKTNGELGVRRLAEQAVLSVMQQQIAAEKQLQQVQAEQAMALAQKAATEQARVNDMKTLMKTILQDLDAFDKQGAKSPKALEAQEERLRSNVEEFRRLFMAGEKIDVSDLLGLDQLQRRVEMAVQGGVSKVQVSKFWSTPDTFSDLRDQIEKGLGPIRAVIEAAVQYDPKLKQAIEGMSAEEASSYLGRQLADARQQKIKYEELERKAVATKNALIEFADNAKTELTGLEARIRDEAKSMEGATAWSTNLKLKPEAERLLAAAKKFATPDTQMSDKDFQELQAAHEAYVKAINPSAETLAQLKAFEKEALAAKEEAAQARQLEGGIEAGLIPATQAEQRIRDIEAALQSVQREAEKTKKGTEEAYQGASLTEQTMGQVAQTDMSNLTGQINGATSAMWNLAAAAMEAANAAAAAASAASGVDTGFVSHGGLIPRHFDRGGFAPRGTDTVPAMLTPGEFVMNARSTRRFYSQLLAMNAGSTPVFRSSGGEASSVTIGDINVNGAAEPRETAREVIRAVRREFRRGTSRSF